MRSFLAGLCGVLACLLLPVSIAAVWAQDVGVDTDGYVKTVRPLATDPEVQDAVEDRLVTVVMSRVEGSLVARRFGEEIRTVVTAAVRQAVESDSFEEVWSAANRGAHLELIRVLDEDADSGAVRISLTTVVAGVLTDLGLSAEADDLPDVSITVARGEELDRAERAYRAIEWLHTWAPPATALLAILALLLARRRVGALAWLGLGAAVGGAVLLAVAWASVDRVGDQVPREDRRVAELVWEAVLDPLRAASWVTLVAGVVVAVVCGGAAILLGRRQAT